MNRCTRRFHDVTTSRDPLGSVYTHHPLCVPLQLLDPAKSLPTYNPSCTPQLMRKLQPQPMRQDCKKKWRTSVQVCVCLCVCLWGVGVKLCSRCHRTARRSGGPPCRCVCVFMGCGCETVQPMLQDCKKKWRASVQVCVCVYVCVYVCLWGVGVKLCSQCYRTARRSEVPPCRFVCVWGVGVRLCSRSVQEHPCVCPYEWGCPNKTTSYCEIRACGDVRVGQNHIIIRIYVF
jgi:hypothetical protein